MQSTFERCIELGITTLIHDSIKLKYQELYNTIEELQKMGYEGQDIVERIMIFLENHM